MEPFIRAQSVKQPAPQVGKASIYLPRVDEDEQGAEGDVKGIENPAGFNNCFINVVIQSLWHLGSFRHRFL